MWKVLNFSVRPHSNSSNSSKNNSNNSKNSNKKNNNNCCCCCCEDNIKRVCGLWTVGCGLWVAAPDRAESRAEQCVAPTVRPSVVLPLSLPPSPSPSPSLSPPCVPLSKIVCVLIMSSRCKRFRLASVPVHGVNTARSRKQSRARAELSRIIMTIVGARGSAASIRRGCCEGFHETQEKYFLQFPLIK